MLHPNFILLKKNFNNLVMLTNYTHIMGFLGGTSGKESACQCRTREMQFWSLGRKDPLE